MWAAAYEGETRRLEQPAPERVLDGRYALVEPIATTGISAVYLARDLRSGRRVALKRLALGCSADLPDRATAVRAFRREARALRLLHDAPVPRLYAAVFEPAATFLVMEYIHGTTLECLLDRGRQPMAAARRIADRLCAAVEALHCHTPAVIHADIKPSNVLLTPDGRVVLIDFGLSRLVGAPDRENTPLGTFGYAPPEQARGRPLDERSDIYALGWTLHALFERATPTLATRMVLARATALDPARRYASVAELRAALRAADRLRRRWPAAALRQGAAVVAVVLLLLFAVSAALSKQPAPPAARVIVPLRARAMQAASPVDDGRVSPGGWLSVSPPASSR